MVGFWYCNGVLYIAEILLNIRTRSPVFVGLSKSCRNFPWSENLHHDFHSLDEFMTQIPNWLCSFCCLEYVVKNHENLHALLRNRHERGVLIPQQPSTSTGNRPKDAVFEACYKGKEVSLKITDEVQAMFEENHVILTNNRWGSFGVVQKNPIEQWKKGPWLFRV